MYKFIIMKQTLHAIEVSFQNYHPSKTLADIEGGGGLRVCNPPFQISKIKERNKTKQKMKTILLKRKKKELHVCLVFMCTRINKHVSFKIFLLTPPPFWKISGSAPGSPVCIDACLMISTEAGWCLVRKIFYLVAATYY